MVLLIDGTGHTSIYINISDQSYTIPWYMMKPRCWL